MKMMMIEYKGSTSVYEIIVEEKKIYYTMITTSKFPKSPSGLQVAKSAIHSLEIVILEQASKLDKIMVYEVHKTLISIAKTANKTLKLEAL